MGSEEQKDRGQDERSGERRGEREGSGGIGESVREILGWERRRRKRRRWETRKG